MYTRCGKLLIKFRIWRAAFFKLLLLRHYGMDFRFPDITETWWTIAFAMTRRFTHVHTHDWNSVSLISRVHVWNNTYEILAQRKSVVQPKICDSPNIYEKEFMYNICLWLSSGAVFALPTSKTLFLFLFTFVKALLTFQQLTVLTKSFFKRREKTCYWNNISLAAQWVFAEYNFLHKAVFTYMSHSLRIYEPPHDETIKMACAPSEDPDQHGHPPSLIRVFAVRLKKVWVLNYPFRGQRRLWSDWADAQADLSLLWAHTHFVDFVMKRLIYTKGYGSYSYTIEWLNMHIWRISNCTTLRSIFSWDGCGTCNIGWYQAHLLWNGRAR